jgi:hypothetical protein
MLDLQEVLVNVWQQTLVDGAKHIELDDHKYPVKTTAKRRLKQVDFQFDRPRSSRLGTESRHKVTMGEDGMRSIKVMQFLDASQSPIRTAKLRATGFSRTKVRPKNSQHVRRNP